MCKSITYTERIPRPRNVDITSGTRTTLQHLFVEFVGIRTVYHDGIFATEFTGFIRGQGSGTVFTTDRQTLT